MSDIFISYSSKDKEKADQLSELLASAGLSVWIDRQGIGVSSSWSKEIVQAIDGCKAFVVLLSPNSVASVNVAREVSLASEQKKKILPLDLEPVDLSEDLRYHLAGIQRAPMTNIDAIIRALGKIGLEATQAPALKLVKESDSRKSLMILPFEDMSPTGDNGWFADGLVSELISALSNVKALHVADAQATKEFKQYHGQLTTYAREMNIRYFVQGDVRKFGDNVKITSRLLDIETGDHLWQDSLKGTMEDIFDIQETVARNVVAGLDIILSKEEQNTLDKRPTENAEAYEYFLKASAYIGQNGPKVYLFAIQLLDEAIKLDPNFAQAYYLKAAANCYHYREYARVPTFLERAKENLAMFEQIAGATSLSVNLFGHIAYLTGNTEDAITASRKALELNPKDIMAYSSLSSHLFETCRYAEAVDIQQRAIELMPNNLGLRINQIFYVVALQESSEMRTAAEETLPYLEKEMLKAPENEDFKAIKSRIMHCLGNREEALQILDELAANDKLPSVATMNVAYFYQYIGFPKRALEFERLAIERGLRPIEDMRRTIFDDPVDQAKHEAITRELEVIIEKEKNG